MASRIEQIIEEIEEYIDSCKFQPLSTTKIVVNKEGSFCNQELYFHDHGTDGAKFVPPDGTTEKVYKLYIDGVNMPRGTYGATGSGAQYIDDRHFSGTGIARVMKDDLTHPLILIVR